MTNTYDEYAEKAAARYLQGRMDEQAAWVEAVKAEVAEWQASADAATRKWPRHTYAGGRIALDALLRRMGVE